jgi:hypothetical protein
MKPLRSNSVASGRRISTFRGLSHAWIDIDQNAGMARLAI